MIKAIIFDWAGVIGADGYWAWLKKDVPGSEERIDFFEKISGQVDSGELSNEEFVAILVKESGQTADMIWNQIKSETFINWELVSKIKELKGKYKIGLLSNFTYPWLSEILTMNNLWEIFDDNIISSEYGIVKPDAKIYLKMLDMLAVSPEEAVFTDDRQVNVDGAKAVGMNVFLFKDNETLLEDLKTLGIN